MNNQDLRKVLLKVGDRLSNESRKRLHFLLGDTVTRPIQDDTTIHGTLDLWQSLFDQGKINESDVTVLISAFRDIDCMGPAKDLQEYMQSVRLTGVVTESTEAQIIQTTSKFDALTDDQEDIDKGWKAGVRSAALVPINFVTIGLGYQMGTVNVTKTDKVVICTTVSDEEHEICAQRNPKIMKD
ncbi:unnamed protein product [Adineta ricciae]|uniref:DED domain-containing protein n=1 Tax=Adineta ricciae TaxID=249248 RepID=A0A814N7D3_ADIRI|nr:unnamed protein product [Adineta ricciae]